MNIFISDRVQTKLNEKHGGITPIDIRQCFANRSERGYLIDAREDHRTNPMTLWFISETNQGRKLKICFVPYPDRLFIKTAYEPNEDEMALYGDL